jgi:hypothetical protein
MLAAMSRIWSLRARIASTFDGIFPFLYVSRTVYGRQMVHPPKKDTQQSKDRNLRSKSFVDATPISLPAWI